MMKIQSFVLIFVFLGLSLLSCNNPTYSTPKFAKVFELHFRAWYSETPVYAAVDGQEVLDDTLSTGTVIGRAAIVPLDVMQGQHHIKVIVNSNTEAETTVNVSDSLYVAVQYFPDQDTIEFRTNTSPYVYD